MTQSTIRVDGANMVEVKVVDDDHAVSWKVTTKGRLEFVARAHNVGEYLALSVEEMPYGVNARNRATMATLEKPAALSLRNMLIDTFGQTEQFKALEFLRDELRTHIDSFRDGLECAAKLDENPDNRAYWKHEVKALGDIEAALNKTLNKPAPLKLVSRQPCPACGSTECNGECMGE